MLSIMGISLATSGLLIGWVIGANDAANSMGTAVGAGVRSEREAIVLVSVFGLLGAILMGGEVVKTLGERVIPLPNLPGIIGQLIGLSAMLAAGMTILVCTFLSIPVSTSHAIVGGLIGGGISAGLQNMVNWSETFAILGAWVLTPLGAFVISIVVIKVTEMVGQYPIINSLKKWSHLSSVTKTLLTITGCYMAFNWGANDVANASGVVSGVLKVNPTITSVLGGFAMSGGVILLGKRVMATIGRKITCLTPFLALVAEFSAAFTVNIFTLAGLPVSTTHAIVGAVGGIGFSNRNKKYANVRTNHSLKNDTPNKNYDQSKQPDFNLSLLWEIALTWFLTPLVAGSFAFFFLRLFKVFHRFFLYLCQ